MPIAFTMKDASKESGLSIRKLYDLIANQELESTTIGRRRLIIAKSLQELITGKARKPSQERGKPEELATGGE